MVRLSETEINILRFIRRSRHKTTLEEVAKALQIPYSEAEVFVNGLVQQKLLNLAPGSTASDNGYYTNPERREEIYDLIG